MNIKSILQRIYKKINRIIFDRNPINIILGRIIYGNDSGLRKNLIGSNKLYKNFIKIDTLKEENNSNLLRENGYVKIDNAVNQELINIIKEKFEKKIHSEGDFKNDLRFDFSSLNNPIFFSDFEEVKKVINRKIIDTIQGYFNTYITITNVHIYRIKKNLNYSPLDLKSYGSTAGWHNDGSSTDTLKIFFSLNKLGEKDGPMEFISSQQTRDIFRKSPILMNRKKLRSRVNSYKKMLFSGNEAYIINTNQCLHRAMSPESDHRDLLVFVCNSHNKKTSFNWEADSTINIYK
jgi:hypothetical protein